MASDEQFSLCWNNFHANMSAGFHGLLSRGDLVDVTLAAEGRLLQAHKLVLSVCSPYFQEMFKMNPTQHPIVFLKDVSHSALRDLLQFMYQGEVNVKQEELASFISTAEQLQVKGLTGNQNEESSTPSKPKPTSRPGPRSSQQRQSVMTKIETDLDSKPSSTPVAVKRPNRPSIASNNSSSSQSGPAKRKCVDPLEAGPSGSAKEEFVTIPDEDENAVAPKMEPEYVNESVWDDDDDGANNEETNFGEDDSNMEMSGFDGSTTDANLTGTGEGGAVGDAQDNNAPLGHIVNVVSTDVHPNESDDDVIEVIRNEAPIVILSDDEEMNTLPPNEFYLEHGSNTAQNASDDQFDVFIDPLKIPSYSESNSENNLTSNDARSSFPSTSREETISDYIESSALKAMCYFPTNIHTLSSISEEPHQDELSGRNKLSAESSKNNDVEKSPSLVDTMESINCQESKESLLLDKADKYSEAKEKLETENDIEKPSTLIETQRPISTDNVDASSSNDKVASLDRFLKESLGANSPSQPSEERAGNEFSTDQTPEK